MLTVPFVNRIMNFIVERAKSFFLNNPTSSPTTQTPTVANSPSPSNPIVNDIPPKFAETPANGDVAEMEPESDDTVVKNVIATSAGTGMGEGRADQVVGKVAAEIVENSAPFADENASIVFPQDVESASGTYSGGGKDGTCKLTIITNDAESNANTQNASSVITKSTSPPSPEQPILPPAGQKSPLTTSRNERSLSVPPPPCQLTTPPASPEINQLKTFHRVRTRTITIPALITTPSAIQPVNTTSPTSPSRSPTVPIVVPIMPARKYLYRPRTFVEPFPLDPADEITENRVYWDNDAVQKRYATFLGAEVKAYGVREMNRFRDNGLYMFSFMPPKENKRLISLLRQTYLHLSLRSLMFI